MKFATETVRHTHLTLGMLLHYLGKLKIQIFETADRVLLRKLIK